MNKVIILLALCTIALAQVPPPCVTPPQWEARLFEYNEEKSFYEMAKISYDSVYQRVRIIEEFRLGNDQEAYDILNLHALNVQYQFNLRTRQCTKLPLTTPFRSFGIPPNATFYGENYIGSSAVPGANLLTTVWGGNYTDNQGKPYQYMGVWTLEACLPVDALYIYPDGVYHAQFLNIVPGISDPSRFIPRRECLSL